jgi:predicted nucleotidyltransferase
MQSSRPSDGESAAPKKSALSTEDPEVAGRFNRVLEEVVASLEDSGLRYAFIGGIASGGLGRPRSTYDIDLFVRPEDAELALRALQKRGFQTERTDPNWLYKAFKEDILVDVIFKSKGEIYFDQEMHKRVITAEYHGRRLRLVSPEDLLIIKAAAHSEATPNHWQDAIALLSYANLDWSYVIWRARRAPRRVLSLLLYAQSIDVWVPNQAVHELYHSLFGGVGEMGTPALSTIAPRGTAAARPVSVLPRARARSAYATAHLREALAEDPRTNELDILIDFEGDTLLLRGEVAESERKAAVEAVAREVFPNCRVENQLRVLKIEASGEPEEMK